MLPYRLDGLVADAPGLRRSVDLGHRVQIDSTSELAAEVWMKFPKF
jgi:hypothetical protein